MPSSNKTSLGLNQWTRSDKPKRDDFNSDNFIIDEEFKKLQGGLITWTPRISDDSGNAAIQTGTGSYQIVGSLIYIVGNIVLSSRNGMTEWCNINAPIPLLSPNPTPIGSAYISGWSAPTGFTQLSTFVRSSNYIAIIRSGNTGVAISRIMGSELSNNANIYFTIMATIA